MKITRASLFSSLLVILSLILIVFCIRAAYTTSLFPIYPDEMAERILLSRMGDDFPIKGDLMPMCRITLDTWPILWYFPGILEWMIHGHIDSLTTFRLVGVITSWLVLFLITFQLCQSHIRSFQLSYKKISYLMIALGLVLSLMEIGVVPFTLVTLRPEQSILFYLSILLIIFSIPITTFFKRLGLIVVFFMVCSLLLYQHTKAVFFAPVLLVMAYRFLFTDDVASCSRLQKVGFRRQNHINKKISLLLMSLLMGFIFLNYITWKQTFFACPNSEIIRKIFSKFNINLNNLTQDFSLFLDEIVNNMLNIQQIFYYIAFQATPEVDYLPRLTIDRSLTIFNQIIYGNYVMLLSITFLGGVFSYVKDLLGKKIVTNNLITLLLMSVLLINVMINKSRHWYDAGYFWSLLSITFIFYLSDKMAYLSKRILFYIFVGYLLLVGISSQYFLIHYYESLFKAGFEGPGISLVTYQHEVIKNQLDQLSAQCHIDKNKSKNVIVDDVTYLYFQKSQYPLAYTYLFYGFDEHFLRGLDRQFAIDGLVINARLVARAALVKKYAVQVGELICIPKQNITPFFREMFDK